MNDAQRLVEIYLELQKQAASLFEIMERHPEVKVVKDNLSQAMFGLTSIAHDIFYQAKELKKEEDNG